MEQVKGCFKELYVTRYWYVCESDYTCPHHKILGQYTVEVATVSEYLVPSLNSISFVGYDLFLFL